MKKRGKEEFSSRSVKRWQEIKVGVKRSKECRTQFMIKISLNSSPLVEVGRLEDNSFSLGRGKERKKERKVKEKRERHE